MVPHAMAEGSGMGLVRRSSAAGSPAPTSPCLPLIGRERELDLLVEAAAAPASLVIIEGEAGIGKTRLVREMFASAELGGRLLLVGYGHRVRDPFPLGPLIEALGGITDDLQDTALSPMVGALRQVLPELGSCLPALPEPFADLRAQRHRLFRALRELMGALGPTVCILEDLDFADEETLEFLPFLLSHHPKHLTLVLTYRGENRRLSPTLAALTSEPSRTSIKLRPLSVEGVRTLAGAILGRDEVSEEVAGRIHELTAGIPFATVELVGQVRGSGDLTLTNGDFDRLEVPEGIRHLMLGRLERLDLDARLIARCAAVLGIPAEERVLRKMAGLSPARAARALTQTLENTVLEETDARYGFRHALASRTVYEAVPRPERERLHLRGAQALESSVEPRPLAQLAYQFAEGGRPGKAVRYAEAAADAASSEGDDRAAARVLENTLSSRHLSRAARTRLAIRLGQVALYSVSPEKALGLLRRTLDEDLMPQGVRGELRLSVARLLCHSGDANAWHAEMVQAIGELSRRPDLRVRAMVNLAIPMLTSHPLDEHLRWLHRAVKIAERHPDRVARTAVLAQRAPILLSVGDPTGWTAIDDIPRDGRSPEEQLQLLRSYHGLSTAALMLGHHRHAEDFHAEASRINDELNHRSWRLWLDTTAASIDWAVGRWERLAFRVRKLSEDTAGLPSLSMLNQIILASFLLARGEIEDSESCLRLTLEQASATGSLSMLVAARAGIARIHLIRGDPEEACRVAEVAVDTIRQKAVWVWGKRLVPVATEALLACGDRTRAKRLVNEFAVRLLDRDAPASTAALASCRGAIAAADGGNAAAVASFERAEQMWAELPAPYDAARAREQRARCLLAQNNGGSGLLVDAFERFERLGASWDAGRVRAELTSLGIRLPYPWGGGRQAYGEHLSPRELQVAQMAASGWRNREIAQALFISSRTVEKHVAAALKKLGVDSRHALASCELDSTAKMGSATTR